MQLQRSSDEQRQVLNTLRIWSRFASASPRVDGALTSLLPPDVSPEVPAGRSVDVKSLCTM